MSEDIPYISDEELNTFLGDSLSFYMSEIEKYPQLSEEEIFQLCQDRDSGDSEAYQKLVYHNLRLVVSVAYCYQNKIAHMQLLDVIQEGNVGLMKAAKDYNPNLGYRFSTYAVTLITSKIKNAIPGLNKMISGSGQFDFKCRKYAAILMDYREKGKNPPSDEEMCKLLDVTMKMLQEIKNNPYQQPTSLNQKIGEEEDKELIDTLPSYGNRYNDILNSLQDKELLLALKELLSPLYYFILYRRFLDKKEYTHQEIASELGVRHQRIAQLEKAILLKIKFYMVDFPNKLQKKIVELRRKGNHYLDKGKTAPIQPKDIILYIYIKDYLTEMESKILSQLFFGKLNNTHREYARLYNVSLENFENILLNMKNKIYTVLTERNDFHQFQEAFLKEYKTKLFEVDYNNCSFINYERLRETYGTLSYTEMIHLYGNLFQNSSDDSILLLQKYFHSPSYDILNKEDLEREVNAVIFGYHEKGKSIPIKKLHVVYLRNQDRFNKKTTRLFGILYF